MLFRPFIFVAMLAAPVLADISISPERPVLGQLVRVTYANGDRVGVIAKGDGSVDISDTGQGLLVFVGLPGKYAVIGFDADGRFFSRDVAITQGETPNPPGPTPTPEPDVIDVFGFGKYAYAEAKKTGDKQGAKALSEVWYEAATKLYSDKCDVQSAVKHIQAESNTRLGAGAEKWRPWARAMELKFEAAKIESALDHVRAFHEVSKALGVYSQ